MYTFEFRSTDWGYLANFYTSEHSLEVASSKAISFDKWQLKVSHERFSCPVSHLVDLNEINCAQTINIKLATSRNSFRSEKKVSNNLFSIQKLLKWIFPLFSQLTTKHIWNDMSCVSRVHYRKINRQKQKCNYKNHHRSYNQNINVKKANKRYNDFHSNS